MKTLTKIALVTAATFVLTLGGLQIRRHLTKQETEPETHQTTESKPEPKWAPDDCDDEELQTAKTLIQQAEQATTPEQRYQKAKAAYQEAKQQQSDHPLTLYAATLTIKSGHEVRIKHKHANTRITQQILEITEHLEDLGTIQRTKNPDSNLDTVVCSAYQGPLQPSKTNTPRNKLRKILSHYYQGKQVTKKDCTDLMDGFDTLLKAAIKRRAKQHSNPFYQTPEEDLWAEVDQANYAELGARMITSLTAIELQERKLKALYRLTNGDLLTTYQNKRGLGAIYANCAWENGKINFKKIIEKSTESPMLDEFVARATRKVSGKHEKAKQQATNQAAREYIKEIKEKRRTCQDRFLNEQYRRVIDRVGIAIKEKRVNGYGLIRLKTMIEDIERRQKPVRCAQQTRKTYLKDIHQEIIKYANGETKNEPRTNTLIGELRRIRDEVGFAGMSLDQAKRETEQAKKMYENKRR